MRLKIYLLAVISVFCLHAGAQEQMEETSFESNPRASAKKGLFGKVVESKSNKGIEAASVQVFQLSRDSTGNPIENLIGGMLTQPNGDFNFTDLNLPDSFTVRVS